MGTAFGNGEETVNMLTPILLIAGLVGFAIVFKSIDFFDKI